MHDTANPSTGANAKAHAAYVKSDTAAGLPVSWHFTVDSDGAVQHLPLDERGYHAGDGSGPGNTSSIGVEICENADGDRSKTEENAARLVAWLLLVLRLDASAIVPHKHWTSTQCPHLLSTVWDSWVAKVSAYKADFDKPAWDPAAEIELLRRDGLIDSEHDWPKEVTWAQFATVINRLRRVKVR